MRLSKIIRKSDSQYILAMVDISGDRSFLLPKVVPYCGILALHYI